MTDGCATLVERDFLQPVQAGFVHEQAFRFRHQLLRDVAYESLSKARRAELHEGFAGWLEATAGNRVQEFEEILGHHLERAYTYKTDLGPADERSHELAMRAGDRLGTAGSRAYARGDMPGACKLLSRSLSRLLRDDVARAELLRKLDDAHFELGEHTTKGLRLVFCASGAGRSVTGGSSRKALTDQCSAVPPVERPQRGRGAGFLRVTTRGT